ncbi:transcriptional regulator, XRE family with cupin sensor [Agreia bicolorata]|uniref:Transcriptional regulator, XRE family with cupin sensor n=1 Tax=Agreia bicolorata TaxID=110935 RepID=A0A1T4Y2Z4_9MICO|nr:XRE family transcriptional regulator [Agreia bicolorata]SKA96207.1 transcriptional regulator, XRE family with cupin sensor [Agreia bicolorata]
MSDVLNDALARTVQATRAAQNLSVADLAQRSGVSRAMIARIERSDVQPTAALLARLSAGLGLTLSELIVQAESDGSRLQYRDDQKIWTDPETGYSRRSLSPSESTALELVEVTLPPGAVVAYPAEAYRFIDQQIWVIEGSLDFTEGADLHELRAGDCLALGEPVDCTFFNPGAMDCRYLVALTKVSRFGALQLR